MSAAARASDISMLTDLIEELVASDTAVDNITAPLQSSEPRLRVQSTSTPRSIRFSSDSPYSTPHKEPDDPNWPAREVSFSESFTPFSHKLPRYPSAQSSPRRTQSRVASTKIDDHIYTRGFLEGACSDIQIQAFGKSFALHRIVLDRSPFFSMMFAGSWKDSDSRQMELKFDDINITCTAFEFALSRLYGKSGGFESIDCLSLLATAAYLDLSDLQEQCTNWLLRSISADNIASLARFVTGKSTYGIHSDRLREATRALLYRDGYDMTPATLSALPIDFLAEIVGSDAFFCPSEIDRYHFVVELIRQRELLKEDVEVLEDVLRNEIYYMHMTHIELKRIQRDGFVDESILYKALWDQIELKEEIEEAAQPVLGVTQEDNTLYPVPVDDTSYIGDPTLSSPGISIPEASQSYSIFPPFRFSAEFERISDLKEDTRLYSHTVFYAGSYWNIYIHNKIRARKARQLGVYLHRVEIKPSSGHPSNTENLSSEEPSIPLQDAQGVPLGVAGDCKRPYIDHRSTISTYFKIYCPSRKGTSRTGVTEFSSGPDEFHRSQSWGWKSRGLCAYDERELTEGEHGGEIAGLKFMVVLGVV